MGITGFLTLFHIKWGLGITGLQMSFLNQNFLVRIRIMMLSRYLKSFFLEKYVFLRNFLCLKMCVITVFYFCTCFDFLLGGRGVK